jgi:hypothetical protein
MKHKHFELLLQDNTVLRELLDVYLELRQHFQELGFSESQLENPPIYTKEMMGLHQEFIHKLDYLLRYVKNYGFDITREELVRYVEPFLTKINELTPLSDVDYKRDDSGDEDY